jgi:hypothetical protein
MDLGKLSPMNSMNTTYSKMSTASLSTQWHSDSSSESIYSYDEGSYVDMKMHSTPTVAPAWTDMNQAHGYPNYYTQEEYRGSKDAFLDHSDMPSTRENSPEPAWNTASLYDWRDEQVAKQYQAHRLGLPVEQQWNNAAPRGSSHTVEQPRGRQPRRSSREPPAMPTEDVKPPTPPPVPPNYQTVLIVPAHQPVMFVREPQTQANVMIPMNNGGVVPFPMQATPTLPGPAMNMQSGVPALVKDPSSTHPSSVASDNMSQTSESKEPAAATQKSGGKTKNRGYLRNDSAFNKMSAEQKEALCKYIYDFMVQKNFTSQEGYLIVDVFSEVWNDMGDTAEGWRVAQHRFGSLLRSAPQYFRLFRRSIRVANQCGWFARKGEKMVRLVLEKK